MSAVELIQAVFLAFEVGVVLLCCAGLCLMEPVYDRLHFLGPATILGPVAVTVAVVVRHSSAQAVIRVLLVVVLLVLSPILTHATARAARVRHQGCLDVEDAEQGGSP